MNRLDIMLDLETLGTGTNPAIIQISAVPFILETGVLVESPFNRKINPLFARDFGNITGSTLAFWFKQEKDAIDKVILGAFNSLDDTETVLSDFFNYIEDLKEEYEEIYFWGNGIISDNTWIESVYERMYKVTDASPIEFWQHRDVRTIVDLCELITNTNPKKEIEFVGTPHDAIDDCKHQIKYVCEAFMRLNREESICF